MDIYYTESDKEYMLRHLKVMLHMNLMQICPKKKTISTNSFKNLSFFYLSRHVVCQCKPSTTPQPPKQCKEVEGTYCQNDDECGVGGYCNNW